VISPSGVKLARVAVANARAGDPLLDRMPHDQRGRSTRGFTSLSELNLNIESHRASSDAAAEACHKYDRIFTGATSTGGIYNVGVKQLVLVEEQQAT
jgi:hypothetical protein